ncbi:MAG: hypothetical protein FWG64_12900 [Firmicutes bacterium]|nr:hypothetical protein [Bacillota bacterium]
MPKKHRHNKHKRKKLAKQSKSLPVDLTNLINYPKSKPTETSILPHEEPFEQAIETASLKTTALYNEIPQKPILDGLIKIEFAACKNPRCGGRRRGYCSKTCQDRQ